MPLEVRVTGESSFHRFADACKQASRHGVDREFDRGLRAAGKIIEKAVRATTDTFMPKGYEATFKARLTTKTQVRIAAATGVTVIAYGLGRSRRRDVERMEQGVLRHPVFGRWRARRSRERPRHRTRNPWVAQPIKPGWFSIPVAASGPAAIAQIDTAVGRVFESIDKVT